MRNLLGHILLNISLGIIFLAFGICLFRYIYPYNVMDIKDSHNIQVNKTSYVAGERLTYILNYCKNMKKVGRVYRSLINGTVTTFTPIQGDIPVGCHTIKKTDLSIPEYTESGIYHLEATIVYKVNPIKDETYYWRSEDFKVVGE